MAKTKKPSKIEQKEAFLKKLGQYRAKKLTKNATKWEKIIYSQLKELGIKFEFQKPVVIKKKYLAILDFYLPDKKICIEVDSKQYHSAKEDIKKDRLRTRRLKTEGIFVIRLWNSFVSTLEKEKLKQILEFENPLKTVKKEQSSLKD